MSLAPFFISGRASATATSPGANRGAPSSAGSRWHRVDSPSLWRSAPRARSPRGSRLRSTPRVARSGSAHGNLPSETLSSRRLRRYLGNRNPDFNFGFFSLEMDRWDGIRQFGLTPDEAHSQDHQAHCQGDRADVGKVDKCVWFRCVRRSYRKEEGHGQQNGGGWDGLSNHPLHAVREPRLLHVAQNHQGQHQEHARVGMAGAPEGLTEFVLRVRGIAHQQRKNAGPTKNNRRHQDHQNAGGALGFTAHLPSSIIGGLSKPLTERKPRRQRREVALVPNRR